MSTIVSTSTISFIGSMILKQQQLITIARSSIEEEQIQFEKAMLDLEEDEEMECAFIKEMSSTFENRLKGTIGVHTIILTIITTNTPTILQ